MNRCTTGRRGEKEREREQGRDKERKKKNSCTLVKKISGEERQNFMSLRIDSLNRLTHFDEAIAA